MPRGYFYNLSQKFLQYRVLPLINQCFTENKYQLIHAHTEQVGLAVLALKKQMNIPLVVTMHGIQQGRFSLEKAKNFFYKKILSEADRVILVGSTLSHYFSDYVQSNDHFRVVNNGFRLPPEGVVNNAFSMDSLVLRFISVSNLHEGKGIDINLYALSKLKETGVTQWTYKIVGDGRERKKLEHIVNELNFKNYIIFCGACQHSEVCLHLKNADVFILPSCREAFGVAYLEAMSCGVLTIGIKDQRPSDFIEDRVTGLLAPPKDVEKLAFMLREIFFQKKAMQQIAKRGKKYVDDNFTWEYHAKKLQSVYEELVKN